MRKSVPEMARKKKKVESINFNLVPCENLRILLLQYKIIREKFSSQNNIAAFVYEPLVQGAAAMKMHNSKGLDEILKFCKKNNKLFLRATYVVKSQCWGALRLPKPRCSPRGLRPPGPRSAHL